jgi:hypothetical protein
MDHAVRNIDSIHSFKYEVFIAITFTGSKKYACTKKLNADSSFQFFYSSGSLDRCSGKIGSEE